MKANYRFFFLMLLFFAVAFAGCSEEDDPIGDDTNSEEKGSTDEMYFPAITGDEWQTVDAQSLGWDTTNLNEAIRYARDHRSYNLLIIHKGKMVAEKYWRETTAASQHELNSVAKSFMGFVIGVLQQDGTINVDDKISDYMGAGWSSSPETEDQITVRHLMTMTSGLNEELQSIGTPGEVWQYSHAAYKVLYEVIAKATNRSYRDVFESILFSKIGMSNYSWIGRDVASSARDAARFGLLIMNNGTWNGQKLINDDGYFNEMLSTSQSMQEAYGYLWWLNGSETWYDDDTKTTVNGSIAGPMPADSWLAKGKHDQRIYIVPSLDLVVIRQGAFTGLPESGEGSFDAEFWERLMRAVKAATPGT